MTGTGLFEEVLHPGERLLWTGRPRLYSECMVGFLYVFMTVEIVRTYKIVSPITGPLPVFLQVELIALAAMFATAGLFLGRRIWRVWKTTYGLSDRRLFMAVGAGREKVRVVALDALDPVRIVMGPKSSRWLLFCLRGTTAMPREQRPPVWKFLVNGQPVKGSTMWRVRDLERVSQLIETARTTVSATAA
jgi:hypothetical protein